MTTKEKLAVLSIADLYAMYDNLSSQANNESYEEDVRIHFLNCVKAVREELNSRITDIFGPVQ